MTRNIFVLALCLFGVVLSAESFAIRAKRSAEDEFHVDHRYPKIVVDGDTYNLHLTDREHNVFYEKDAVYSLTYSQEQQNYVYVAEDVELEGPFYEDAEHMAVLLPKIYEGYIYYDGVVGIGKPHIVEHVRENWWMGLEAGSDQESEEDSSEVEAESLRMRSAYVPAAERNEAKLENPLSVIYPKVLAYVDYPLYEQLGKDINKIVEYVATFYNAVDLKYSKFDSPNVRLVLSRIIVVTDQQVDFLKKGRDYFSEEYMKESEFVDYDVTFMMVASNTDVKSFEEGTRLGSICDKKRNTIYIEDDAKYGGVVQAVHELGHLLNLPHDGYDKAEQCKADDESNTFMAPESSTASTWSKCSVEILKDFVKTEEAKCLDEMYRYD